MHGLSRALLWVLGIGLLAGPVQTATAGFFVRWVETELVNDVYMLDARLDLELGSAPLEALNSGVPIDIVVEGNYHKIGSFISGVANLSRIVTLHDFIISPQGGVDNLRMTILAKTYRYLEEEEG